jgi:hypothetical protein
LGFSVSTFLIPGYPMINKGDAPWVHFLDDEGTDYLSFGKDINFFTAGQAMGGALLPFVKTILLTIFLLFDIYKILS